MSDLIRFPEGRAKRTDRPAVVARRMKRGVDTAGRSYWRFERDKKSIEGATGWYHDPDVRVLVARLYVEQPAAVDAATVEISTVGDILDYWLGQQEDRARAGEIEANTLAGYQSATKHLVETLGGFKIREISRTLFRSHVLARPDLAPSTLRNHATTLRAAVTWAREEGLAHCPTPVAPRLREEPRYSSHVPTAEQFAATVAHLTGWVRDVHLVLWATGARPSEVASLTPADVLEQSVVFGLHRGARKTGRREVEVDPATMSILQSYAAAAVDPAAPIWGKRVSTILSHARRDLMAACAKADVPRWSPKASRHALVGRLRRQGVIAEVVASITGHSPSVMMRYYMHPTSDDRAVALRSQLRVVEGGA